MQDRRGQIWSFKWFREDRIFVIVDENDSDEGRMATLLDLEAARLFYIHLSSLTTGSESAVMDAFSNPGAWSRRRDLEGEEP